MDLLFEVDGERIKRSSDIDLLGLNIDSKLDFGKHVFTICEKANKQVQVIKRFRNLIPQPTGQSSTVSCICTTYLSMLLKCTAFLWNLKQSETEVYERKGTAFCAR